MTRICSEWHDERVGVVAERAGRGGALVVGVRVAGVEAGVAGGDDVTGMLVGAAGAEPRVEATVAVVDAPPGRDDALEVHPAIVATSTAVIAVAAQCHDRRRRVAVN